jgi:hypothetical protein
MWGTGINDVPGGSPSVGAGDKLKSGDGRPRDLNQMVAVCPILLHWSHIDCPARSNAQPWQQSLLYHRLIWNRGYKCVATALVRTARCDSRFVQAPIMTH